MKAFGWTIAALGLCYIIFAFNMNVSISTSSTYIPGYGSVGGGDVANLDLMARRQNHLIFASLITLIGVLLGLFGPSSAPPSNAATPQQLSPVPNAKPQALASFQGERDLSSDAYRLWLADTYAITRNDLFDRFVMADATFGSLDDALAKADEMERDRLAAEEEAERQREEAKEQRRLAQIAWQEEEQARWEGQKPKVIAGGIICLVALGALIYFSIETPEERAAREAAQSAAHDQLVKTLSDKWKIKLSKEVVIETHQATETDNFLCDNKTGGMIYELKPDTSLQTIKDAVSKGLGNIETVYEVDGGGAWYWAKDTVRADLHLIGGSIDLCVQDKK
jgi:hypothetical protein